MWLPDIDMVRHGPSWAETVGFPMYYLWHDLFWAGTNPASTMKLDNRFFVDATLVVARYR
ncbi:hypothetical protein [Flexilinea flocculi]|uniref:hypothetical protein n=1 Tax=Flexilinea flocculi TaxID=1678840 RepID=UPI001260340A|nr:hypothetical protein [Flexilinea flocculi]